MNKKERKIKKLLLNMNDKYINYLVNKSNYIQNKCINKLENEEYKIYKHNLPLINESKSPFESSNWDLTKEEKNIILKYLSVLYEYSSNIIHLWFLNENKPIKDLVENPNYILPPWLAFPLHPSYTIHWRMGNGEAYMDAYIDFIYSLTEDEFTNYKNTYPEPEYMSFNMFRLNLDNYKLRYEKKED